MNYKRFADVTNVQPPIYVIAGAMVWLYIYIVPIKQIKIRSACIFCSSLNLILILKFPSI